VGQGERAKLFTACQRTLHACTAVVSWHYFSGYGGEERRGEQLQRWPS